MVSASLMLRLGVVRRTLVASLFLLDCHRRDQVLVGVWRFFLNCIIKKPVTGYLGTQVRSWKENQKNEHVFIISFLDYGLSLAVGTVLPIIYQLLIHFAESRLRDDALFILFFL